MNRFIVTGTVIALLLSVIAVFKPGTVTTIVEKLGVSSGPSHTELQEFNAGMVRRNVNATTTVPTTLTLVPTDFMNFDTIIVTPDTGATVWTLPASSTLASWLPKAGDTQQLCIYNATTTAAATLRLAAGTGIDLERVATSTGAGANVDPVTIQSRGHACYTFIRQNATATSFDISALVQTYINAD